MKKLLVLFTVGVTISAFIVGGIIFWYYRRQEEQEDENSRANTVSTTEDTSEDATPEEQPAADVEIEILEYRQTILTTCDKVTIKISLENVGEIPVSYSDIANNTYVLAVITKDTVSWSSERGMTVSDFGTLNPGDTAEVTFTGGQNFGDGEYSYHDNEFHTPGIENGSFEMKVSFNEPYEENKYTARGESEPVDIDIDIYEDPSQSLLKSCEGTL